MWLYLEFYKPKIKTYLMWNYILLNSGEKRKGEAQHWRNLVSKWPWVLLPLLHWEHEIWRLMLVISSVIKMSRKDKRNENNEWQEEVGDGFLAWGCFQARGSHNSSASVSVIPCAPYRSQPPNRAFHPWEAIKRKLWLNVLTRERRVLWLIMICLD